MKAFLFPSHSGLFVSFLISLLSVCAIMNLSLDCATSSISLLLVLLVSCGFGVQLNHCLLAMVRL